MGGDPPRALVPQQANRWKTAPSSNSGSTSEDTAVKRASSETTGNPAAAHAQIGNTTRQPVRHACEDERLIQGRAARPRQLERS